MTPKPFLILLAAALAALLLLPGCSGEEEEPEPEPVQLSFASQPSSVREAIRKGCAAAGCPLKEVQAASEEAGSYLAGGIEISYFKGSDGRTQVLVSSKNKGDRLMSMKIANEIGKALLPPKARASKRGG